MLPNFLPLTARRVDLALQDHNFMKSNIVTTTDANDIVQYNDFSEEVAFTKYQNKLGLYRYGHETERLKVLMAFIQRKVLSYNAAYRAGFTPAEMNHMPKTVNAALDKAIVSACHAFAEICDHHLEYGDENLE